MTRRKICVVVTARPSYSRVKTALSAIQAHPELELMLVVSASALLERYGSAVHTIERDGFDISAKVYNVLEGENLTAAAKTTGLGILEISTVFDNLQPDIVVTIADRFETMATAISAAYMNIPLAHIQGGEVTGNIDEKVRHSITKLADYHFVASETARGRVLRLGEQEQFVFNTGCPSMDLAREVCNEAGYQFDPFEKYGGVGPGRDILNGRYIVVMQHPVTTEVTRSRRHIEVTLEAIRHLGLPTFWFWPNVDAGADGTTTGIRSFRERNKNLPIHFFKNMEPKDFLHLLKGSACLIGNSSVGIRECAYMGVPVVNIGSRQAGRDRGHNVIDVGYEVSEISAAVQQHLGNGGVATSDVYGGGDAGQRIADLLGQVPLVFDKKLAF